MGKKVRIGIDVGGTFTDAVVIDNDTYEVIAKKKIPTTHEAGVAAGVVAIISQLMEEQGICPDDVIFIAHGTTQATNALLEGDVASVGVIGMGSGIDSRSAKSETNVGDIELAPGKFLKASHLFLDSKKMDEGQVETAIQELKGQGADVIVASEAYSVDDPSNELLVQGIAQEQKLYCTGGHEISQLYGLKMRTRTAVVNASLIPKMMETANMTEQAVIDTKIKSGLMIMRCDGGCDECTAAAWDALGNYLGCSGVEAAKQVMDLALNKLETVVEELMAEYGLDRKFVTLVGGGGSGSVIVNALAQRMSVKWKMAKNAPYISTIGVALAMVREQMERTIANPTDEDIKKLRLDIIEKIVKSGAKEETVDVMIEVDAQKNILRAIATGATELRQKDLATVELGRERLQEICADALAASCENTHFASSCGRWSVYEAVIIKKRLGLFSQKIKSLAVIDREGVVRLKKEKAVHLKFKKSQKQGVFNEFLDENTTFSDANATIPKVFVFYREKMLDLTGMQSSEQLNSILDVEIESLNDEEEMIAVAYK